MNPASRAQADDALLKQALLLQQADRLPEAEELCHRVLARTPNHPLALNILGILGLDFDDELAIQYLARAVAQAPQNPYFQFSLGDAYLKIKEHELAVPHLQRACDLKPDLVEALCALGRAYSALDDAERALPLFERALEINDTYPKARTGMADVLVSLGRMDDASVYLREAISRRQDLPTAYGIFSTTRKFSGGEPPELGEILRELSSSKLEPLAVQQLNHAAGKILNDLKRYDEAMDHFLRANKTRDYNFDIESHRRRIDNYINIFSPEMLAARAGFGDASELPVFILGMPRSGTTLTEQICSSHPQVHGAGELTKLRQIAGEIRIVPKPGSHQSVMSMTIDQSKAMAHKYLAYLRQQAPTALRIVDKVPHNFELIGLIGILFPGARIIHCRRDAIDNCLSCFISNLNESHDYARDLNVLGQYYREYDRLMSHWKGIFPGRIFENRYEDLIADQEGQSRRLIDYLGLTWDDACLRFFDREGSVRTASRWQVRQPIYTSSVKRWKKYQSKIQPLIDALGDLADV